MGPVSVSPALGAAHYAMPLLSRYSPGPITKIPSCASSPIFVSMLLTWVFRPFAFKFCKLGRAIERKADFSGVWWAEHSIATGYRLGWVHGYRP